MIEPLFFVLGYSKRIQKHGRNEIGGMQMVEDQQKEDTVDNGNEDHAHTRVKIAQLKMIFGEKCLGRTRHRPI